MAFLRRMAQTALTCAAAVSVTLSCFFAWNTVSVSIQARAADRQERELNRLYRQGDGSGGGEEEVPQGIDPRLLPLYRVNKDLVGWLELGGEQGFSAPVVQRDNSYYLKHDFYGREDRHGAVFLDCRNKIDPPEDSLILYGHNLNDGTWFYDLVKYQDPAFVTEDPFLTFNTLYEEGTYVVFGVFVAATLPQHGDDFDYHNQLSFRTIEEKQAYLDRIARRNLLDINVEATVRDQLLTLSTCLYDFAGERLVVTARRLRQGETTESFRDLRAVRSRSPEMPAIWTRLYG